MEIVAPCILLASGTGSAGRVPASRGDRNFNKKLAVVAPFFYMLQGPLPQADYKKCDWGSLYFACIRDRFCRQSTGFS